MSKKKASRLAVDVRCALGEGPIWHPDRASLIWFDIAGQVLYESDAKGGEISSIKFDEPVSAAGLIDRSCIAVAGASGLHYVNLDRGEHWLFAQFEDESSSNRSNDGRVGPDGAFWIGTMDRRGKKGAGVLYRYRDGW